MKLKLINPLIFKSEEVKQQKKEARKRRRVAAVDQKYCEKIMVHNISI